MTTQLGSLALNKSSQLKIPSSFLKQDQNLIPELHKLRFAAFNMIPLDLALTSLSSTSMPFSVFKAAAESTVLFLALSNVVLWTVI
jgi:hypothetical protein